MPIDVFVMGFVFGVVLTVLVLLVIHFYREWIKTRNLYRKPQIVIHTTSKTPEQVKDEADRAALKIRLLQATLFVGLWFLVELRFPGVTGLMGQFLKMIWYTASGK